jgi:hypothetical protein
VRIIVDYRGFPSRGELSLEGETIPNRGGRLTVQYGSVYSRYGSAG